MKFIRLPQFSIRTWFVIGMGGMLLLLVLLGGSFFFYQRIVTSTFEKLEHEALEEMHSIMHLEGVVPLVINPVQDYLLSADPAEREEFNRLSQKLDEAFKKSRAVDFHDEKEREGIRLAWEEWQKARLAAGALLALPHPVGDRLAVQGVKRFNDQMDRIASLIELAHDIADQEVKEGVESGQAVTKKNTLFMFGVFGVGVFLVIVCGIVLVRVILGPLSILVEGANHLGSGRLSHRVVLDHQDELGRLAVAFNSMAERIEKAHGVLNDIATHDGLTGLLNYREFVYRLNEEVERGRRYRHSCALLIADVDHFKTVNDTWGHPAGDEVLRAVAARILREIRPTDRAARCGGEEFAILLPETEGAGALALAERVRAAFAMSPIILTSGQAIDLTLSIGVAAFPDDAGDEEGLIAAADRALYAAKQAGRNRVCAGPPSREAEGNVA